MTSTGSVLAGLFFYIVVFIIIGWYANLRAKRNTEDFFLASRNIGPVLTVFALGSSLFSMWFFMGAAGFYYHHGVGWTANVTANLALASAAWFLGLKIWRMGKKHNAINHSEILGKIFNSEAIRLLTGIVGILFTLPYVALQVKGAGAAVSAATNGQISFIIGATIFLGVVIVYTFLGGQRAVVWTDMVQGAVLLVIALSLAWFASKTAATVNGMPFFESILKNSPESLTLPGPSKAFSLPFYLSTVIMFALGFPMFPYMNQRYMMTKSEDTLRKVFPFNMLWMGLGLYIPLFIGFSGRVLYPGLEGAAADNILPMLLGQYAPGLMIILVLGAYAAALSTVDGMVISVGSIITRDFVQRVPGHKEESAFKWSRISIVFCGLFAWIFALYTPRALIELGVMATAGVVQLAVPTLIGMFWKWKVHSESVIIGLIVGVITIILCQFKVLVFALPLQPGFIALALNFATFLIVEVFMSIKSTKSQTC